MTTTAKIVCKVCQKPAPGLVCSCCSEPICKSCARFIEDENFAYWPEAKKKFAEHTYCTACFDTHVAATLAEYDGVFERAGRVAIFFKEQSKETRLIKRREELVHVKDGEDYDGSILRLAYQAALVDCNALVDVVLSSHKVKIGGYTKTHWTGIGRPVRVEERVLNNERVILRNPN